jgi:hypothetical protein
MEIERWRQRKRRNVKNRKGDRSRAKTERKRKGNRT